MSLGLPPISLRLGVIGQLRASPRVATRFAFAHGVAEPPDRAARLGRAMAIGVIGGLAITLVIKLAIIAVDPQTPAILANPAQADGALYRAAGQRILSGGPVYPAFELGGPYTLAMRPELYPPPTLLFLVAPMAALPAFLWWLVPLGTITAILVRQRPSLIGWVGILLCLAWPPTGYVILAGNPIIWAAAFVALGSTWKGAAVLTLVKPTLAPFALVGIRSRSWWLVAGGYVAFVVALSPLWLDYLTVLRNAVGLDPLYSLSHVPMMLIPAIAWWTRVPRDHTHRIWTAVPLDGRRFPAFNRWLRPLRDGPSWIPRRRSTRPS